MVGHRWSVLQQDASIQNKRPKDAMATLHVRAERARGEVRLTDVAGNPAPLVIPEAVVPFESVAVGLLRKAHPDLAWKAGHRFGLFGVGNESDAFGEFDQLFHCSLQEDWVPRSQKSVVCIQCSKETPQFISYARP